eukprot:scaffold312984_cov19-Tisochrysis_lutea.AAC.1
MCLYPLCCLSGLACAQALERVENAISTARWSQILRRPVAKDITFIVGKGLHSQDGVAKIKPAVLKLSKGNLRAKYSFFKQDSSHCGMILYRRVQVLPACHRGQAQYRLRPCGASSPLRVQPLSLGKNVGVVGPYSGCWSGCATLQSAVKLYFGSEAGYVRMKPEGWLGAASILLKLSISRSSSSTSSSSSSSPKENHTVVWALSHT